MEICIIVEVTVAWFKLPIPMLYMRDLLHKNNFKKNYLSLVKKKKKIQIVFNYFQQFSAVFHNMVSCPPFAPNFSTSVI